MKLLDWSQEFEFALAISVSKSGDPTRQMIAPWSTHFEYVREIGAPRQVSFLHLLQWKCDTKAMQAQEGLVNVCRQVAVWLLAGLLNGRKAAGGRPTKWLSNSSSDLSQKDMETKQTEI
jgi:hypothetical protein